jgi:hypothetical protein
MPTRRDKSSSVRLLEATNIYVDAYNHKKKTNIAEKCSVPSTFVTNYATRTQTANANPRVAPVL